MWSYTVVSLLTVAFSLLQTCQCAAQQIWSAVSVEKEVIERVDFQVQIQQRGVQHPYKVRTLFTDGRLSYDLLKRLQVAGSYRYRFIAGGLKNRYATELSFRPLSSKSNLVLKGRLMYQRDFGTSSKHTEAFRFLAEFRYRIAKCQPAISVESFQSNLKSAAISKIRSTIGIACQMSRYYEFTVFYRRDDNYNARELHRDTDYIIGIMNEFELKPPKVIKPKMESLDQ